MENINWFEVICGIIELLICVFLAYNSSSLSYMFCMLGGYHFGKGLYGGKD